MTRLKKSEEIKDRNVTNTSGFVIGTVNDYLIDLDTWQITDIQVKIDKPKAKELGLKAPFFGSLLVLFGVETIVSAEDQIVLRLERDDVKPYIDQRKNGGGDEEEEEEADG